MKADANKSHSKTTIGKYWIKHPQQIADFSFWGDAYIVYLHSQMRYVKRNEHTNLSLYKTVKYASSFFHCTVDKQGSTVRVNQYLLYQNTLER